MIRALLFGLVLALAPPLFAESLQDGPYVSRSPSGAWIARWVSGDESSPAIREESFKAGGEITVAAVGELPTFKVKLRAPATVPAPVAPSEVKLSPTTPLFVMADTHGEFQIAVQLLKSQKIIDSKLKWSFGKGHLAVLGDIFDRGPNQTEILWLLYQLEGEAARAGGAVHVMLGNHESMALGGDERYLNPKYLKVREALHVPNYAALWGADTLLGQWLRTKSAVMKIGDYLCLHGGISREVIDRKLTLAEMNDSVRGSLGDRQPDGFVMGPNGPLWYRGYFPDAARGSGSAIATADDVGKILAFYDVKAIFVGHTIVPTVTSLYDGRVIAVQVYPHRELAHPDQAHREPVPVMEALRVERGQFFRARIDGSVETLACAAAEPEARQGCHRRRRSRFRRGNARSAAIGLLRQGARASSGHRAGGERDENQQAKDDREGIKSGSHGRKASNPRAPSHSL